MPPDVYMPAIDYLTIGHVSKDVHPAGSRLGGTVAFSALTAAALGLRVGIVTSAPDSLTPLLAVLEGVAVARLPCDAATAFENIYTPQGRTQRLVGRAARLGFEDVPPEWRAAPIVHLAPIADEIDPLLALRFSRSFVGITPQGWMRRWDEAGRIGFRPWLAASCVLAHVQAVVFSLEDVQGDQTLVQWYGARAKTLVVTQGALGCTLYSSAQAVHIPAPEVEEIDPTGAGDIFAAAFFVRLYATGEALPAARFAARLASYSVTREGLDGIPGEAVISQALAEVDALEERADGS